MFSILSIQIWYPIRLLNWYRAWSFHPPNCGRDLIFIQTKEPSMSPEKDVGANDGEYFILFGIVKNLSVQHLLFLLMRCDLGCAAFAIYLIIGADHIVVWSLILSRSRWARTGLSITSVLQFCILVTLSLRKKDNYFASQSTLPLSQLITLAIILIKLDKMWPISVGSIVYLNLSRVVYICHKCTNSFLSLIGDEPVRELRRPKSCMKIRIVSRQLARTNLCYRKLRGYALNDKFISYEVQIGYACNY
jgi:hypothetical protein